MDEVSSDCSQLMWLITHLAQLQITHLAQLQITSNCCSCCKTAAAPHDSLFCGILDCVWNSASMQLVTCSLGRLSGRIKTVNINPMLFLPSLPKLQIMTDWMSYYIFNTGLYSVVPQMESEPENACTADPAQRESCPHTSHTEGRDQSGVKHRGKKRLLIPQYPWHCVQLYLRMSPS